MFRHSWSTTGWEKKALVKDTKNLEKYEDLKNKEAECYPEIPLLPFPQRLKKSKVDVCCKKFFEKLRNSH